MPDNFEPYIPRIIAAGVAGLASWATKHFGVQVAPEVQTAIVLAVYAIVHRALSSRSNPMDVAKASLVPQTKDTTPPKAA